MPRTTKGGPGGKISSGAGSRDQLIRFNFRVEGLDRTSNEFKAVRRNINERIRDTMVRVGEKELLPDIHLLWNARTAEDTGRLSTSLKIIRERSGVFVGSSLRLKGRRGGPNNRAVGLMEFGGLRSSDGVRFAGIHAITDVVDRKRGLIDRRVLEAVLDEFKKDTTLNVYGDSGMTTVSF